jgi:hypothetical protein
VTGVVVFVIIVVPLSLVLYWYSAQPSAWKWVVAVDIVLLVACLLTLLRQSTVFVAVMKTRLTGNGIFSRVVSVERSRIVRVVLAPVYNRNSSDTSIQFMALDSNGGCLFRMRGTFWHEPDLLAVAKALGVDVLRNDSPLSSAEFFDAYPGSRYWFERT